MSPKITNKVRLDVMPDGNLAMEVGDLDAVVILTPKHARKLATEMRTRLCGDDLADLLAERQRINMAIGFKRRKWQAARRREAVQATKGTEGC